VGLKGCAEVRRCAGSPGEVPAAGDSIVVTAAVSCNGVSIRLAPCLFVAAPARLIYADCVFAYANQWARFRRALSLLPGALRYALI